jgi:hypothetical protein
MCCGGGSTNTSTSSTTLDPAIKSRFLDLLDRGKDVSNLPYQGYSGDRLAPLNADQEAGIAGVQNAASSYQPDLQTSRDYATAGAAPLAGTVGSFDQAALDKYSDPYNQSVIDSTIADIDRTGTLARRDLDARAGAGGGIGTYGPSERATLDRSEQWRDQEQNTATQVAQLRAANFNQAQNQFNTEQNRGLAAGQNDAARAAGASSQYAGIAGDTQGFGLQGANALYGAGTSEQNQAQKGLDIPYSDFLAQRQYPFDTTNFLSGIYRGYPGGTGTTTTTQPGPNTGSQIAGLGIAGLGALGSSGAFGTNGWLFNRGGIVGRRTFARGGRMARGGIVRSYRDGGRVRMANGGIVGYAPGGTVQVFAGMSNADLGRLIDVGNSDAYDEYVRRLTSNPTMGPLPDTSRPPPQFMANKHMPAANDPFINGHLSDTTSEPHYSGSGDTGTDATGRNRPLNLSDMGISGWKGFTMPDWAKNLGWPSTPANADLPRPGQDMSGPDYTAPEHQRGQPTPFDRGQAAPLDNGIAPAVPTPAAIATGPLPPRKPMIGHNGGPPIEDSGIMPPSTSRQYADSGRGIVPESTAQALVKKATGADPKSADAPSWAMPMMIAGLSMAASRNPSMLGALGEAGISGLSAYVDQKRQDSANAIETAKISREVNRDAVDATYKAGTLANQAEANAGLNAYRDVNSRIAQQNANANTKRADTTAANASGKGSLWQTKHDAWMAVHPDDTQGALDYAAGFKRMSDAELRKAAAQIANDLQGGQFGDPAAKKTEYETQLDLLRKGNEAKGTPPAATKSTPPQGAVDYLKAHPEAKDQFEQKYGAGTASTYMQ